MSRSRQTLDYQQRPTRRTGYRALFAWLFVAWFFLGMVALIADLNIRSLAVEASQYRQQAQTPFGLANIAESLLWWGMSLVCLIRALRLSGARAPSLLAAVVLFMFGLSDLVEVRTGAWWKPRWLLLWKVLCVTALLALLVSHIRQRPAAASTTRQAR